MRRITTSSTPDSTTIENSGLKAFGDGSFKTIIVSIVKLCPI
jgi:hypothetical protein